MASKIAIQEARNLQEKLNEYFNNGKLSFSVDYPSTYGIYEDEIKKELFQKGYDPIQLEEEITSEKIESIARNYEEYESDYIKEYFLDKVAYDSPKWIMENWENYNMFYNSGKKDAEGKIIWNVVKTEAQAKKRAKENQEIYDSFSNVKDIFFYENSVEVEIYEPFDMDIDFDVYEDNAQYRDELDFNVEDVRRWDAQYSLLIEEIEMMIKGFETNFTKEYVIEDIVNNSMLEKKEELTKENYMDILQKFSDNDHVDNFRIYYGDDLIELNLNNEEIMKIRETFEAEGLNSDYLISMLNTEDSKRKIYVEGFSTKQLFKKLVDKKYRNTQTVKTKEEDEDIGVLEDIVLEQGVHKSLVMQLDKLIESKNEEVLINLLKQNPENIEYLDGLNLGAANSKNLVKKDEELFNIIYDLKENENNKEKLLYNYANKISPLNLYEKLKELHNNPEDIKEGARYLGERITKMNKKDLYAKQDIIDYVGKIFYVIDGSGMGYHRGFLADKVSENVLNKIIEEGNQFSFYSISDGKWFVETRIEPILNNPNLTAEICDKLITEIEEKQNEFAPVDYSTAKEYGAKIIKMIKDKRDTLKNNGNGPDKIRTV